MLLTSKPLFDLQTFISCDDEKMQSNANFWSLMFVVIAVGLFVFTALEKFLFSLSGERLTERLRSRTFKAYLRQEIAFFDNPSNSTGALTARLATEVSAVQGVSISHNVILDDLMAKSLTLTVRVSE